MQFVSTLGDRKARVRELEVTFGTTTQDLHAKCMLPGALVNAIDVPLRRRAGGERGLLVNLETRPTGEYKRAKLAHAGAASAKAEPAVPALSVPWRRPAGAVSAKAGPASPEDSPASSPRVWVRKPAGAAAAKAGPAAPGVPPPKAALVPRAAVAAAAQAVPNARATRARLSAHLTNANIHNFNKSARKKKDADGEFYTSHTARWRDDAEYRAVCAAKPIATPEWLVYPDGKTARLDGGNGDEFPH